MPENNTENPWVEGVKTLALSAVLAFGVRTFVAEARYIPSESMLPTLKTTTTVRIIISAGTAVRRDLQLIRRS